MPGKQHRFLIEAQQFLPHCLLLLPIAIETARAPERTGKDGVADKGGFCVDQADTPRCMARRRADLKTQIPNRDHLPLAEFPFDLFGQPACQRQIAAIDKRRRIGCLASGWRYSLG